MIFIFTDVDNDYRRLIRKLKQGLSQNFSRLALHMQDFEEDGSMPVYDMLRGYFPYQYKNFLHVSKFFYAKEDSDADLVV